jgi:DNA end-binding protein Ku
MRAYALLHRVMTDTGKAGIATFVMHGKEYLAAIRATPDVLALETMFFADEIRDPREEIEDLPPREAFCGRELTIAKRLIESMTTGWSPENYRDTYRERVEDLIERKQRGEEVVTEGRAPEESNIVDLMDALRRSAEAQRRRPAGAHSSGRGKGTRGGSKARGGAGSGGRTAGGQARSAGNREPKARSRPKRKAG